MHSNAIKKMCTVFLTKTYVIYKEAVQALSTSSSDYIT